MPHFIKMGLSLMVVGMIATAILSWVDDVTRAPIAESKRQELLKALVQVLPKGFENAPEKDFIELADKRLNRKEKAVRFYRARKSGSDMATAYVVSAPDGYSGNIDILMAVTPVGAITGVQIVAHAETPGLGDKAVKTDWALSFNDKTLQNAKWGVKKDGGDFDQFAGATITPRAIVGAVKRGLDYFEENKERIFKTPAAEAVK